MGYSGQTQRKIRARDERREPGSGDDKQPPAIGSAGRLAAPEIATARIPAKQVPQCRYTQRRYPHRISGTANRFRYIRPLNQAVASFLTEARLHSISCPASPCMCSFVTISSLTTPEPVTSGQTRQPDPTARPDSQTRILKHRPTFTKPDRILQPGPIPARF